jgi:DedD protein
VNILLKQRLVGAVVLVSLGVIFIPMLLPGDGDLSVPLQGSNVPPAPDYRFTPPPTPPQAPVLTAAAPVVDAPAEPAAPAAAEPSMEALAAQALPPSPPPPATKQDRQQTKAWVVQVGSFSSRKNAHALRDKLRKQGYACFVESIKGEAGTVYRVRVGPELTRDLAEKLQQRLKAKTQLHGMVMQYP